MIQWCVTSSKNLHSYLFMSSPMTTRECLAAGPRAYGHDVRSMCRLVLHSSLLSSPQPVLPVLLPFFPLSPQHIRSFPSSCSFPPCLPFCTPAASGDAHRRRLLVRSIHRQPVFMGKVTFCVLLSTTVRRKGSVLVLPAKQQSRATPPAPLRTPRVQSW